MLKQLIFVFAFALVVLLSSHRALAEELEILPELNMVALQLAAPECQDLGSYFSAYQLELESRYQVMHKHISDTRVGYDQWYEVLAKKVNERVDWPISQFHNVRMSINNLLAAGDILYTMASWDEEFVVLAKNGMAGCKWETEKIEKLQELLDQYVLLSADHLGSVATFLNLMSFRLEGMELKWRLLEGKSVILSPGHFDQLQQEIEFFKEAGQLINENSEFVFALYNQIQVALNN